MRLFYVFRFKTEWKFFRSFHRMHAICNHCLIFWNRRFVGCRLFCHQFLLKLENTRQENNKLKIVLKTWERREGGGGRVSVWESFWKTNLQISVCKFTEEVAVFFLNPLWLLTSSNIAIRSRQTWILVIN